MLTSRHFVTSVHVGAFLQSVSELKDSIDNQSWRAPVAACVLGGIMVLLFNIFSCIVLVRKSINKSGPGEAQKAVHHAQTVEFYL